MQVGLARGPARSVVGGTRCSWSRSAGPSLLGRYPGAIEEERGGEEGGGKRTFHAARTTGRRSLALGRTPPPCLGGRGCVSRLGQSQPRQTASLCCIRDQPRQFRTLLLDFRRPCPCCTHRLHPPIEPPLGPNHQFRRSKKLLSRHHFHDPPPTAQSSDSNNAHRSRPYHDLRNSGDLERPMGAFNSGLGFPVPAGNLKPV